MRKSKLFLLGISIIFSAILVYGTALVLKFLTGYYLFEKGLFDLANSALALGIAVPLILYILLFNERNKLAMYEVIANTSLFVLLVYFPVSFTSVSSDSVMSRNQSVEFIAAFIILVIILIGTLHLEVTNKKWFKRIAFIGISFLLVVSLVEATSSSKVATMTDDLTKSEINTVVPSENSLLVVWASDNMDRGNHDYDSLTHNDLVVDLNYSAIQRGDVLYFNTPEMAMEANSFLPEQYIARAVGLPGETVEIINGQVFIDHKKLESFYSTATARGMGEEEYFEKMDPSNINEESMRRYFSTNMKSVKVEENTVFVLVDQWWRGTDSRDFGVLPIDTIKGKVLGYKK